MRYLAILLFALAGCARYDVSPLAGAARSGDREAIRRLAWGDQLNSASGVNGWTPLEHAVHKNQPGSVEELLAQGANPNAADRNGRTPLIMAAGYGEADIVRLLLAHGADPMLRDPHGKSALDAAKSGVADIDKWTIGHPDEETVRLLTVAIEARKLLAPGEAH
jgi:ankyrin repeat protein